MESSDGIDESVIILHCNYPDCLMEFDNRWSLTRHEKTHTGEKHFKCFTCSKRFVQKCSLTRHEHTHSDEKPFPCTHSNCGKRFKLKEYLRTHLKIHKKAKAKKSEKEQVDEQGKEVRLIRENLHSISVQHHVDINSDHKDIEEMSSSLQECRRALQTAVDLMQRSKRVPPTRKQLFFMEAGFFVTTQDVASLSQRYQQH